VVGGHAHVLVAQVGVGALLLRRGAEAVVAHDPLPGGLDVLREPAVRAAVGRIEEDEPALIVPEGRMYTVSEDLPDGWGEGDYEGWYSLHDLEFTEVWDDRDDV
jgi:hypothetical protein